MDGPSTTDGWAALPRTSLAIVVGLTALLCWLLFGTAPVGQIATLGVGSALLLALSLWLVDWERWQAVGTLCASLLVLPTAIGLTALIVGTVVVVVTTSLPVSSIDGVRPLIVAVVSHLVLVTGCVTAVFGATAATRGVIDVDRVEEYSGVVFRTLLVPLTVVTVLFFQGLIAFLEAETQTPGVRQLVGDVVRQVTGPLFHPVAGRTHVAIFCLMLALAASVLARALDALPVTELLPETEDGQQAVETVERIEQGLRWNGRVALFVVPIAALVELVLGQRFVASVLPSPVYGLVVALTATPGLRRALWTLFLAGIAVTIAVWFLRRTVQSSADRVGIVLAPYLGGLAGTLCGLVIAGPIVTTAETAVSETLPEQFGQFFQTTVAPIIDHFGAETILLFGVVLVLGVVSSVVGVLWLALATRYVRDETAGVSVAGAGLFVASAFAATLDASPLLVLAGIVGAIVVWDVGAFGTTLGREIGSAAGTRRTELVHTGGTVAVGGLGALVTVGLAGVARGSVSITPSVAVTALGVCLVAIVALVAAIR